MRTILFFALFALIAGCDVLAPSEPSSGTPPDGDVLLTTSFEAASDTAGWYGNGALAFEPETPEGGGQRSAYVAGGCVHPHSAVDLIAPRDGQLRLWAWGKNLAIGGGVHLANLRTGESRGIGIQDEAWARYEMQETLTVRRGDRVQLSMSAGGFAASAMLVDLVEVAYML